MEQEVVRESVLWERALALATLLLVALVTFVAAKLLARLLKGTTRLGLRGLERLAAPVTLVATLLAAWLILLRTPRDPPIVGVVIELLGIAAVFWLAARVLDVVWTTGTSSARLRRLRGVGSALLATRQLGKAAFVFGAVAVIAVRMGASAQLYVALGAIGAALTFAARAPIANAVAFAGMLVDPPFHIGDRVRIGDYRGGDAAQGEVVALSLSAVTIRSKRRTLIAIPNALVGQLRVENLSHANRRRLEFELPIDEGIPAETVRAACATIEDDLRASEFVSEYREPRVWIGGHHDGLHLKASAWLRRGRDRREAQRELLLLIRSRFDQLVR